MGVSGLPGDPAYPPHELPMPALPIGKVGRVAAEGMNRLGWHWWPGTHAMPSRDWGRQKACARRGTCMTGCPEGAKGSMDITHWPDAIAHGARLVTGARVRQITTNAAGLATGAIWIDRNGVEHHEPADVVVLARQRRRHAAAAPALGLGAVPGRSRELLGPRRSAADDASVRHRDGHLRRRARELARPGRQSALLARVLRDRPVARASRGAPSGSCSRSAARSACCPVTTGCRSRSATARGSTSSSGAGLAAPSSGVSRPTTCPRRATASRSTLSSSTPTECRPRGSTTACRRPRPACSTGTSSA